MIEHLKWAFQHAQESYRRDLELFWPTVGSRGFTEQNQVHRFCKAAEKVLLDPVATYLEMPFRKKNDDEGSKDHLDGLIVNLVTGRPAIVLIEAKRITEGGYDHAYKEIAEDVARLREEDRISHLCMECIRHHNRFPVIDVYFVYLADVWVGNKVRSGEVLKRWPDPHPDKSICKGWEKGTFLVSDPVYRDRNAEGKEVRYHLLLAIAPWKYVFGHDRDLRPVSLLPQ